MRDEYDFSTGRRGSVSAAPAGKTRITIRIDDDVLAWFREQVHEAGGGSYQTLINEALRSVVEWGGEHSEGRLEAAVRRVVREEINRAGVMPRAASVHERAED